MNDKQHLRPAIDILMCHADLSFNDACHELGINPNELNEEQAKNHPLAVKVEEA